MRNLRTRIVATDPIWDAVREEATADIADEPLLASFLHAAILKHDSLEQALSFNLANKLDSSTLSAILVREVIDEAFDNDPTINQAIRCDLQAVRDRDPACQKYSTPLLYFKGFHALQAYRVGHYLIQKGRESLAYFLQNRVSEVFGVDMHPAAKIGSGIMIDHATSVVIGETAVVGDNVSMLHEVTLGGTGKECGDRHPKVRSGVLIGAGAKILGNVVIGEGAKIGAGSVVLESVAAHCSVAGVPAEIVGTCCADQPALDMDHHLERDTPRKSQ